MSTIIVTRQDGTVYDLDELGFRVIDFNPPSPQYTHTFLQAGHYGQHRTSTVVGNTQLKLVLNSIGIDVYDYELQRQKLMRIFSSYEAFYVSFVRLPQLRYRCVAEPFEFTRFNNEYAKNISITLDCYDGFAETVATTENPDQMLGLGIGLDDVPHQYNYSNVTDIPFYNPGLIALMAEERPVSIRINANAGDGITLTNKTTGQTFTFNKSLSKSDTLLVYGYKPVFNGSLDYTDSNHQFLDFVCGQNDVTISGTTDYSLQYISRFYYA